MGKLCHTRDGRTICAAHARSGAPAYHTDGCDACADARAKGIIRPDVGSVAAKKRGRMVHRERWIDWDKIKPENRKGISMALHSFRASR